MLVYGHATLFSSLFAGNIMKWFHNFLNFLGKVSSCNLDHCTIQESMDNYIAPIHINIFRIHMVVRDKSAFSQRQLCHQLKPPSPHKFSFHPSPQFSVCLKSHPKSCVPIRTF